MARPYLILHHVTYTIPDTPVDFQNLSLNFEKQRTAIIGHNGLGKSTLLKLLTGTIQPHKSSVPRKASLDYQPQEPATLPGSTTVGQAMGIGQQWQAWQHIMAWATEAIYYEILGERWQLEQQAQQCLSNNFESKSHPGSYRQDVIGSPPIDVSLSKSATTVAEL